MRDRVAGEGREKTQNESPFETAWSYVGVSSALSRYGRGGGGCLMEF